jgi:hypothetical protein
MNKKLQIVRETLAPWTRPISATSYFAKGLSRKALKQAFLGIRRLGRS